MKFSEDAGASSKDVNFSAHERFPAKLHARIISGQIGGEGETSAEDKEAEAEAEAERLEALREAEERRKDKHRKMEEERERMRQGIRDKVRNNPFGSMTFPRSEHVR